MENLNAIVKMAEGLGWLSLFATLYFLAAHLVRHSGAKQVAAGLILGLGAVSSAAVPFELQPGIQVDARNVFPALAGIFAGPVAALLASVLPAAFRLSLGGDGAVAGAISPLAAGFLAWTMWRMIGREGAVPSPRQLSIIALVAGSFPVASFLLIPNSARAVELFFRVGPAVLLANVAGIMLLGTIFRFAALSRQAVADTKRADAILRGMFDHTEVAHFAATPEGEGRFRIIAANGAALCSLGKRADEVVGRLMSDYLSPERFLRVAGSHMEALKTGSTVWWEETVSVSGEDRIFEISVVPVPGTEDVPTMLFSKKRDITLQKEAALAREKAATTDVLTGLGNRRFADERLGTDLGRARRYGEPLSVLLMDIDHFKRVNDTYGHDAGDRVLEHFGRILRDHARTTDAAARWGGEEFIMIAPQTDIDGALLAARRICESTRKQPVAFGTADIAYTVSIGVVQLTDQNTTAELVASADQELYGAKRAGRDRVFGHVPAPVARLDFLPQRSLRT